ncbi:MAG: DUF4062 domain-containing protein [Akkermansiaceae bacterium]|nr:DUF4062 domain-containing protein [Akkermansiaceae bacterium]
MAIKVFISSVQSEFSAERKQLFDYIREDALLGGFFEPYIFEETPAMGVSPAYAYLNEVKNCDIYIGLYGLRYGYEDAEGISPTEREYDMATACHKLRLIFITTPSVNQKRHPKQQALIEKAEQSVIRRCFADYHELRDSVYSALVRFLIEKSYIRKTSFDDAICHKASMDDIDQDKVIQFVKRAHAYRLMPLSLASGTENLFTHLSLMTQSGKLTNAAILLFGKRPQDFFPTAVMKCALFYGTRISKPMVSQQIFGGTLFEMVDKALDFVMSRLDSYVGTRERSNIAPVKVEIPQDVVAEAIVNAVVHRDYTSNAGVQVMVFSDRVEIWNPGQLPYGLSPDRLSSQHYSVPYNPKLAHVAYLAGYIEQMGTGTTDMVEKCLDWGLRKPLYAQEECFKVTLWRRDRDDDDEMIFYVGESDDEVYYEWEKKQKQANKEFANTASKTNKVNRVNKQSKQSVLAKQDAVVAFCSVPRSSMEIMQHIGVTRQTRTVNLYIGALIEQGRLQALIPGKPNSPKQRYIAVFNN